ncbi:MAG: hypothetical protein M3M96_04270 [Candidatus Eremiobacteraeota bacterium]|nr:hypothetical protein [Candidatus Eremiobacteraeota bacterium]
MSLELLNTLATLATSAIVAATAIAALIQLRHLRASNQIQAQLSINDLIQSDSFRRAIIKIEGLKAMISIPELRWAFSAPLAETLPPEVIEMRKAAGHVGSNLENIGNMVRNRLTNEEMFIEQFGNVVDEAWEALLPYTCMRRKFSNNHDAIWEDFEYLTILSRKWTTTRRSAFPPNMRRILPPWTELDVSPGLPPQSE